MRLMRLLAGFTALALLSAALPAAAVPVRGLYEASVPVADQSPQLRDSALRRALEVVLVRVTGQRNPAATAGSVLSRATMLVQGYGYEAAPGGAGLRLRARFDPRATDAALRALGVPVWGPNRPAHVVWIALRDDGQARGLLDAAGIAARAPAVASAAEARGLPFTYPLLDAAERTQVRFNDVCGGNMVGVEAASQRYEAAVTLAGCVGREGGDWVGRWTALFRSGASESWTRAHGTLEEALAAGVDELADREAQRFAIQAGATSELRLRVDGVDSLQDYGRVLGYLRGLNAVRSVQVEAAAAGELALRLQIDGEAEALSRAIANGRTLRRQAQDPFERQERYVLVR
jgi:uncharacterized protein